MQTFTLAQKGQTETAETFSLRAPARSRHWQPCNLRASPDGDGFDGKPRSYPIQSRTPYFPVTEVKTEPLDPAATFQVSQSVLDGYAPGSGEVAVSFSRIRGVEPGPLLDSLYRYPWGCTEQLTSSAMPLLFVDVLGGELDRDPERAVRPRVQKAVNKLLNRQGPDGAFGLWRVGDRYANAWLGPYVTDFLYRAKAEGLRRSP